MKAWLLMGTSLIALSGVATARAAERPIQGQNRIQMALEILARVPSGHALIKKSLSVWNLKSDFDLLQFVKPGPVSRTDAVLTRHFDSDTGKESREREVTVYVNDNQSLVNMILDIAHEMVHATSRPSWDPYDPHLTAGQYILSAIDGEGGEVQAVATECKVAIELSKNYQIPTKRCQNYLKSDQDQTVEIDPIRRDFYRVGQWKTELSKQLGAEISLFPKLSADPPELYSSTGNAPYPVALLKEYQALTQVACENTRRRYSSSSAPERSSSKPNRSPASENDSSRIFLERRCN
jgi:hypothetical protein